MKNLFPLVSGSAGSESVTEEFDTAASAIMHALEGVAFKVRGHDNKNGTRTVAIAVLWLLAPPTGGNSVFVTASATDRWQ